MKRKFFRVLFALVLVLSFSLVTAVPAGAATPTTIDSSTMIFEGTLSDAGGGVYTGTIPMVDEAAEVLGDLETGFDLFARNGATAVFDDVRGLVGPTATAADHDGWPGWDPDTPDWDYYALTLTADSWLLVYNANAPDRDWEVCGGVPMSGTMDWTEMYAAETDLGHCFGDPVDVGAEFPGSAAANGGGAACWDMDWAWGYEVVPLAFPGFDVAITDLGGDSYRITMIPAAGDNPPGPVVNEVTGESFGAIQDSIDAPETLDTHTINVEAGLYAEGDILIDKALTIQGAGKSVTIVDASGFGHGLKIAADDVTIEGLTVEGADTRNIVWYQVTVSGTRIEDVKVTGAPESGIEVHQSDVTNVLIKDCDFIDGGEWGLRFDSGSMVTGFTVDGCTFDGHLYAGIGPAGKYDGLTVTGCHFTNSWCGIEMSIYQNLEGVYIDTSNFAAGETQFSWAGLDRIGIYAWVETPGLVIENIQVHNCSFTGYLEATDAGVVFDPYVVGYEDVIIDTEYNWWGDVNGPYHATANPGGTGGQVSDNVDFSPWLPGTWETYYDPATEAEIDSDGDGFSDLQEYWLGTDPTDAEDYPGAAVGEVSSAYAGDGGTASTETSNASIEAEAAAGESALVSLAEYTGTPEDESVFGAVGSYVDVHTDTPENLEEVEIRVNYDDAGMTEAEESGLRMSYWNSDVGDWRQCSDQGVDIVNDFIWARIRDDTTPDLSYLSGGPFGGGLASVELDSEWYRTDETVAVTIEDATESGLIAAFAWSETVHEAGKITFPLYETGAGTGIFEGDFDLVDTPPGAGELLVNGGDLITVAYLAVGYTATVDDTAPLVSVIGPLGPINLNTPVIAASYSDDASGIDTSTAVMTVDGVPAVAVVTVTELGISYHPIEPLGDGEHTVTVDVSDVAGNAAMQASWSFTVNTIKPHLDIGLDPAPPYTEEGTVTFTLTFDEDMDIAFPPVVTFGLIDPYDQHPVTGAWTGLTEWIGTFVIEGIWAAVDGGMQTLSVSGAKDLAGNVMGTDTSTTFVIDLKAPDVPELTSPGDGDTIQTTAKPTFEWDPVTDVSGVLYWLQVDDSGVFTSPELDVSDIEATTYTPPEALANADYIWRVIAIDGVGNAGSWSAPRTFTLNADTIAPSVNIITPNGGEVWEGGSEETITWTADDNITPLEDLEFTLDLSRGGPYDVCIGLDLTVFGGDITLEAGVFSYPWTVGDYNNDHCSVRIVVVDLQDNSSTAWSDDYFTITTPVIFEFELAAGWNLISLPMIPDDAAIGTILALIVEEVDIVWGYDPVNDPLDPWAVYVPGVIEDDLTQIVDGMGYWVYMTDPVNLFVSGVVMPEPPAAPPAYDVASGWNLIGFKSTAAILDETYLTNLEAAYSVLWGYEAIEGYFSVYPLAEHDGKMESGYGYWLWATQDGSIVPPQ